MPTERLIGSFGNGVLEDDTAFQGQWGIECLPGLLYRSHQALG